MVFLTYFLKAPAMVCLNQLKLSTPQMNVLSSALPTLIVNGGTTTAQMAFVPYFLLAWILLTHALLALTGRKIVEK